MRRLFLSLIICFASTALAEGKPTVDFKQLRRVCEGSWAKYLKQLETLYDANDQLIVFASAFFPRELEKQNFTGVDSFNDVFKHNVNLQRDMNDQSRSHLADVEIWSNALKQRYTGGVELMPPLDLSVACYKAQATHFKP